MPRRIIAIVTLAAALCATAAVPAQAKLERAQRVSVTPPKSRAFLTVRDGTTTRSAARAKAALHAARLSGSGGVYQTANGDKVKVFLSPQFQPDASVNQSYADLLSSFIHGGELSQVTVYVAPYSEMQSLCDPEADACYIDNQQLMVLTGGGAPDGTPVGELAAHEYGHHVAYHRLNDLGDAIDWGPEYWATQKQVCNRERHHSAFPGDEGAHYDQNPGEAWAETYRVLNGYSPNLWDIIDPSFQPGGPALRAARRDVLHPFTGDQYITRNGQFGSKGSRWRDFVVPVQNDGNVDARLTGSRRLDADLYFFSSPQASHPLASSTRSGRNEHLGGTYCGYRSLDMAVYRYRGTGSFKLKIALPYNSG